MGKIGVTGAIVMVTLALALNILLDKNPVWVMFFFAFGVAVGWYARG